MVVVVSTASIANMIALLIATRTTNVCGCDCHYDCVDAVDT